MSSSATPLDDGAARPGQRDAGAAAPRRARLAIGLLITLFCWLVYMANFRAISAGDTYPARYLPFAILQSHTVLLDPIVAVTAQGRIPTPVRRDELLVRDPAPAFWVVELESGHAVSLYPVIVPLLVSPLYLPAVLYLQATGGDEQRLDDLARFMEKISAALLAALSAGIVFLVLRRELALRPTVLLTLAYALGTTTWVISSQALWQHGLGELLVASALYLLTGPCSRWRAFALGVVLGLIACNRPPDVLIAAALGLYALGWARRHWWLLVGGVLLPSIPVLAYNLGIVRHLAGAYGLIGKSRFFAHPLLPGLAGLLFSPAKGLVVFSPFLLFLPFALPRVLRDPRTRGLGIAVVAALMAQLLLYGVADWRQGESWGPRWLTDLLPLLVWLLIPVLRDFRRAWQVLFVVAVGVAMAIEAIGAFWYTGVSDAAYFAPSDTAHPWEPMWSWRNAPFVAELSHPHAPMELTTDFRGVIDRVDVGDGPDGREITIDGWALANRRTPAAVTLLLDGHRVASTEHLFDRPDVTEALHASGASGWHMRISARGLSAGQHVFALVVTANAYGIAVPVARRSFDLSLRLEPDLGASVRFAVDQIGARQQPSGNWLTSHTAQREFKGAELEQNTYLASLLVDMLDPIAAKAGLQNNVQRARQYLSWQIEADGLVRYHGLPNGPGIGTLGCVITPDADDTALVWRIARDAKGEALGSALKTMNQYRTADGLYRTWLAPRDRYQCLDPGADPNPADIGIQMHVLLLLAKADPPAAQALCTAIKQHLDDDRVWVYYKDAPLVPDLRRSDLRDAGCMLDVPASRQDSTVPEQDIWIAGARLFERSRHPHRPPPVADIQDWLQRVADDKFVMLQHSPPLLYHNDGSASVERYYWSEEYGYALWLRLYFISRAAATTGAG